MTSLLSVVHTCMMLQYLRLAEHISTDTLYPSDEDMVPQKQELASTMHSSFFDVHGISS